MLSSHAHKLHNNLQSTCFNRRGTHSIHQGTLSLTLLTHHLHTKTESRGTHSLTLLTHHLHTRTDQSLSSGSLDKSKLATGDFMISSDPVACFFAVDHILENPRDKATIGIGHKMQAAKLKTRDLNRLLWILLISWSIDVSNKKLKTWIWLVGKMNIQWIWL